MKGRTVLKQYKAMIDFEGWRISITTKILISKNRLKTSI